jgi:transcriptional regulator with XRE-family HTH domain
MGFFEPWRTTLNDIRYIAATDQEILRLVGDRLKALRKMRGLTQADAAEQAGLGRNTLYRAEQGDNPTLQTLIRLLRTYGRLETLESFIPTPVISPMARLRERTGAPGG